jgi:hypothetical protein
MPLEDEELVKDMCKKNQFVRTNTEHVQVSGYIIHFLTIKFYQFQVGRNDYSHVVLTHSAYGTFPY